MSVKIDFPCLFNKFRSKSKVNVILSPRSSFIITFRKGENAKAIHNLNLSTQRTSIQGRCALHTWQTSKHQPIIFKQKAAYKQRSKRRLLRRLEIETQQSGFGENDIGRGGDYTIRLVQDNKFF